MDTSTQLPSGQIVRCSLYNDDESVNISIDGYGTAVGDSALVSIRCDGDAPVVTIRSDILLDRPTHSVSLSGADEDRRDGEITSLLQDLAVSNLTIIEEGRLFLRLLNSINPHTKRRFTIADAASLTGRDYAYVRGRAALARPLRSSQRKSAEDFRLDVAALLTRLRN